MASNESTKLEVMIKHESHISIQSMRSITDYFTFASNCSSEELQVAYRVIIPWILTTALQGRLG